MGAQVTGSTFAISIPTTIPLQKEERPCVIFSQTAERKMKALVQKCADEVAWHGVVDFDPETLTYYISDILVFPQEVTSATAVSVDETYGTWMFSLPEETFNRVRFHGHSHVYMATNPSTIDLTYQEALTKQVRDFYIFMILNKRDEFNIWIYDKALNLLYDKADIDIDTESLGVEAWAEQQLAVMVKKKTYTSTAVTQSATTGTTTKDSGTTKTAIQNTTSNTSHRSRSTESKKSNDQEDLETGYWKNYKGR
jgi:hypothetical protein